LTALWGPAFGWLRQLYNNASNQATNPFAAALRLGYQLSWKPLLISFAL